MHLDSDNPQTMTPLQYLSLIDIQARMLLKSDARKLTLGYLWWFLEPLMWVAVFYLVFEVILKAGRGADFLVFLACGKFAFIWFSRTVNQASNSIVFGSNLIGKIDMPKTLFPMSAIQESLYRQGAVYCLLFVILALFGYPVSWTWLWLVPVVFVYYLMIVACSLVGAYLVCIIRDFTKFIPLGMQFLLFTSGIFWDIRAIGDEQHVELMLAVNPLAFMLDAHRQILMHQTRPDLLQLALLGLGAGALAALMVLRMRQKSRYIALKVLT
jgi:lipopolysaccharide transport system permease protein